MATEIEAKLKVDSLEPIVQRLTELAAVFSQQQHQSDIFFDSSQAALIKSDRGLRLRRQSVADETKVFLTYKGKKDKSNFKKRQEIEIELTDADSAEELLLALGYEKVLSFEKKRSLWLYNDCEIALDELPLLGTFVEIEGPDEQKITDVQKQLGLADLPHVKETYSYMVNRQLQETGE